jgi:hypothetical protein
LRRVLAGRFLADWLILIGGLGLFVALFLTWSHQLPPHVLALLGGSPVIRGVPAHPTAWQVYSVADVILGLLALSLVAVALRGRSRWSRVTALLAVGLGLAFTAHADSIAPTNGLLFINPENPPAYLLHEATPGGGETVALIALSLAAAGLLLSLVFDLSSSRVHSPP